jgi:hypothetical protein
VPLWVRNRKAVQKTTERLFLHRRKALANTGSSPLRTLPPSGTFGGCPYAMLRDAARGMLRDGPFDTVRAANTGGTPAVSPRRAGSRGPNGVRDGRLRVAAQGRQRLPPTLRSGDASPFVPYGDFGSASRRGATCAQARFARSGVIIEKESRGPAACAACPGGLCQRAVSKRCHSPLRGCCATRRR